MRRTPTFLSLILVAACAQADAASEQARAVESPVAGRASPTVLVYKAPTCGCCNGWVTHMQAAGYTVDARDVSDMMTVKRDAGVPVAMSSCHTSLIDGYFVEGHVPAELVARLLADRPDIAGIAAPGMPIGSPGMEGAGARPYQVMAIGRDGSTTVFAEVDPR